MSTKTINKAVETVAEKGISITQIPELKNHSATAVSFVFDSPHSASSMRVIYESDGRKHGFAVEQFVKFYDDSSSSWKEEWQPGMVIQFYGGHRKQDNSWYLTITIFAQDKAGALTEKEWDVLRKERPHLQAELINGPDAYLADIYHRMSFPDRRMEALGDALSFLRTHCIGKLCGSSDGLSDREKSALELVNYLAVIIDAVKTPGAPGHRVNWNPDDLMP